MAARLNDLACPLAGEDLFQAHTKIMCEEVEKRLKKRFKPDQTIQMKFKVETLSYQIGPFYAIKHDFNHHCKHQPEQKLLEIFTFS